MRADDAWDILRDPHSTCSEYRRAVRVLIELDDLAIERFAELAVLTGAVKASPRGLLSEIIASAEFFEACQDGSCPYCRPPTYH
jgi:hypothetical protein